MIVGHKKQWEFLKRAFRLKRIPHGFLFYGQEKLGKRNFALEFIKLINCQNENLSLRPCHKCISCKEIEKAHRSKTGTHPDLVLVEPIKKQIQISQIRDLSLRLASKPSLASFKSGIIDQAHLMSHEAQSCFLKTLEEPKGRTVLILITEHTQRLLPTILSRVQKIKFYPVKKEIIKDYLISQGLSKKKAKEISAVSFGKPGRAIDFFLTPSKLGDQKKKIAELVKICDSPLFFRFQYIKDLSLDFDNLKEMLEIWLTYFRRKLLQATDSQQSVTDDSRLGYSSSKLKTIIQLIQDTIFYISTTNVNPRLALETLVLNF